MKTLRTTLRTILRATLKSTFHQETQGQLQRQIQGGAPDKDTGIPEVSKEMNLRLSNSGLVRVKI